MTGSIGLQNGASRPITARNGPWSLHRRVRNARRADPAGPDRQRPRERVDARLQGRPHVAAHVRRPAAAPTRRPAPPSARRARPSRSTRSSTDFTAEPARDTGEPLDFAIIGDGFFAVQTAKGTRYTRNGQFALDPQGRLVTAQGDPVLDADGRAITATNGSVDPRAHRRRQPHQPAQGGRLARHRHPRGRRHRHRPLRRAGGLRRRRRALDGRHDLLDARLRGRPEGHPDDRRDARQGRRPRSARSARSWPAAVPQVSVGRSAEDRGCMLEGLHSAAAGMAAQQQRLDAVANDLANANTTGYKHQRVGFRDLVYDQTGRSSAQGVRTGSGAAAVDAGRAFGQGVAPAHRPPARRRDPGRGLPARQASRRPRGADARRQPAHRRRRQPDDQHRRARAAARSRSPPASPRTRSRSAPTAP